MTSSVNSCNINLYEEFSDNLGFRDNANRLFDKIGAMKCMEVILDFKRVQTMSRSFAHQYLIRKGKCKMKLSEIGMNKDVKTMIKIAGTKKPWNPRSHFTNVHSLTL